MPEPDFFDECYPKFHRPRPRRRWRTARRFVGWLDTIARRAIAQPAKSAVATLAFGLIVGMALRTAMLRYSGPNSTTGSVVNHVPPVKSPEQECEPMPAAPKTSGSRPPAKEKGAKPIETGDGFDCFLQALRETRLAE